MHNEIILSSRGTGGANVRAVVCPSAGMTLASFSLDEIDVIDKTRLDIYRQCRKGLGPLIGPHFNQRAQLPATAAAQAGQWPQTAPLSAMGVRDPWQHGIGRYVPWSYELTPGGLSASLSGKRKIRETHLRAIEDGDFEMQISFKLSGAALQINYEVEADFPPVIGLHYYYSLPGGDGTVRAPITGIMQPQENSAAVPDDWTDRTGRRLDLRLNQPLDHLFPLRAGPIMLETATHRLWTIPAKGVESLVVFHPADQNWVCVEPLSSANPAALTARRAAMELTLLIEPLNP